MFFELFNRKSSNRKGFTLVELMVGVAIIGLISGIAVPVYTAQMSQASQDKAVSDGTGWSVAVSLSLQSYNSLGSTPATNSSAITLTYTCTGDTPDKKLWEQVLKNATIDFGQKASEK